MKMIKNFRIPILRACKYWMSCPFLYCSSQYKNGQDLLDLQKYDKLSILCRNCHLRDENLADLADAAFHLGRLKVGFSVSNDRWFK